MGGIFDGRAKESLPYNRGAMTPVQKALTGIMSIMAGIILILFFGKRIQAGVVSARNKHGVVGALLTGVLSLAIIEAFLPLQMMKGPVPKLGKNDKFVDYKYVWYIKIRI